MNSEDGQVYSVCMMYCFTKYNLCGQSINKQIVSIADENVTDHSFLSRYHYTKSKNYLKRRYRIRHWIPMFIGTTCIEHCWADSCHYYASSGTPSALNMFSIGSMLKIKIVFIQSRND